MIGTPAASVPTAHAFRVPRWLASLAAGVLAGAALFDLLPAAGRLLGARAVTWALAGIALVLVAARAAPARSGWLGWIAGAGIALHSLVEGMAAAAGYGASAQAGILTSLALVGHLAPETLALFALLSANGTPVRRTLLVCAVPWLLVITGFSTAGVLLPQLGSDWLARAMAFGAGAFLCLGGLTVIRRCGSKVGNIAVASLAVLWVALQHVA